MDDLAFKRWLQRVAEGSGKRIEQSNVFLSIVTASYQREPQCALELGIAVMLDKPIYLIVPKGTKVSENLRRLARGLEFFDPDDPEDMHRAAKRLLAL